MDKKLVVSKTLKQKYSTAIKSGSTQTTINLLLSGRHSLYKRYAGKHVLVIKDTIMPFKSGKEVLTDMKKLEKKYGKAPTLVFVPRTTVILL